MVLRRARIAALVLAAARCDVDLAAENRVQAPLAGVIVEDYRREQVAVFGDGNRRHLQLHRLIEHFVDPAGAVEQRELGVQVEMYELCHVPSLVLGPWSMVGSWSAVDGPSARRALRT